MKISERMMKLKIKAIELMMPKIFLTKEGELIIEYTNEQKKILNELDNNINEAIQWEKKYVKQR